MCGKSPRFDASFRTSRLAWWGAALVLFLISGVVIMVWTASMWPAVLTPVILSFVCSWHRLVPFQQLRIWTWCLSGHADVTARGGHGMIFVWATMALLYGCMRGVFPWFHASFLIPYIKECLVGCCPVAPSDLWCHYNGLDGLRAACRTDVLSIQCGQNGLASAEFALNGNGGLGTSIHDSRVGGGQAMFVKKRWLPMVVYTSLGSCPALIHCNVLVAGKVWPLTFILFFSACRSRVAVYPGPEGGGSKLGIGAAYPKGFCGKVLRMLREILHHAGVPVQSRYCTPANHVVCMFACCLVMPWCAQWLGAVDRWLQLFSVGPFRRQSWEFDRLPIPVTKASRSP
jgi:hypothetical protein